jgi:hypothetical protein
VLHYTSHGDATVFVKTQQHPYDIDQEAVLCNSMQQNKLLLEHQVLGHATVLGSAYSMII